MSRHYFFLLLFATAPLITKNISIPAVTIVPVANLATEPLSKRFPHETFPYEKLPTTFKSGIDSCPRLHQLLFNERVNIVKKQGNDVMVEVPYLFFQTSPKGQKINRYWSDARYFMPMKTANRYQPWVPDPIDFNNPTSVRQSGICTLTRPFYYCPTDKTYSAGTRFITSDKDNTALLFDPVAKELLHAPIPASYRVQDSKLKTPQQRQRFFIQLLKQWVHNAHGKIPYVWGGCSHNFQYPTLDYAVKAHTYKNKVHFNYCLQGNYPACDSGFDCTGLVLRAAQIAQIPYFYKNTTTVGFNLKPLKANQMIENGDLILFPGHIIVISDINKNLVIEARSKRDDYGYIHEIPLNEVFRCIQTYADLRKSYLAQEKLERLGESGKTLSHVPIKIMKLNSAWNS